MLDHIPVIDLARWYGGDPSSRRALANELGSISRDIGFFYLRNHPVADDVVARAQQAARMFFALPLAEKMKLDFTQARKQRGYIPLRAESSDPQAGGDLKEALDFTHPVPARDPADPAAYRMSGPNLWPDGLPQFREIIEDYLRGMIGLARDLFDVFALALNLGEDFFRALTDRPIAQLRLLHYPPQSPSPDPAAPGIGTHCDYECFTLLAQDGVEGLEVQSSMGRWIPAPPLPRTFLVNLGEMLARWTNDTFRATPHRVVNRTGRERYSIAFFFGTNYDTPIECLDTCCGPDNPPRYPPEIAGHYLARRLHEIYGSIPHPDDPDRAP